ncbi:MAG TPA: hypothetical protein VFS39_09140 [Nitrospira sp.]|nr:hypothetical protein [Nitrospira sp.]
MSEADMTFCCAVCRKVKDDGGDESGGRPWCTMSEYARRHLLRADATLLSETYCPDCTIFYDRLVRYSGPEARPSA